MGFEGDVGADHVDGARATVGDFDAAQQAAQMHDQIAAKRSFGQYQLFAGRGRYFLQGKLLASECDGER